LLAAKSSDISTRKKSATQNEAGLTQTERDEADYAVVRPTDVADDNDVNNDYAYPTPPSVPPPSVPPPSVPDDNSNRQYLDLLPEDDEPLRLLAVFTRQETDLHTSGSGGDNDVTNRATTTTEDSRAHPSDGKDSAAEEEQPATYIEII